MADYLVLIVTASFFCAVISSLLNDKGAGRTAKAIVKIAMLAIVVTPIISTVTNLSENLALPVINDEYRHNIDNKENEKLLYREWLAKVTASRVSKEIETSVKNGIGIDVRVECPWHAEGEDVVFDKIRIYTKSDKRNFLSIVNYVKLHFSFDCECFEEVE